MKVLDPGHSYEVEGYDGGAPQRIDFMKREGEGYPGNVGHHGGTNSQELLRVLIDRTNYVHNQIACIEDQQAIDLMILVIWLFEKRAAERHGKEKEFMAIENSEIHKLPTGKDGHIV